MFTNLIYLVNNIFAKIVYVYYVGSVIQKAAAFLSWTKTRKVLDHPCHEIFLWHRQSQSEGCGSPLCQARHPTNGLEVPSQVYVNDTLSEPTTIRIFFMVLKVDAYNHQGH